MGKISGKWEPIVETTKATESTTPLDLGVETTQTLGPTVQEESDVGTVNR